MSRTIDPATICRQLLASDQRARALVAGLTEAQARWRQEPGSVSILDCLLRVRNSAGRAVTELDAGLARAPRARRILQGSRELGRAWTLFLDAWESLPCVRRDAAPPEPPPVRQVLAELAGVHTEVCSRLADLFRRDLECTRMSLPATSWVRIPLVVGLAAIPVHARRQLRRAERVRLDARFPER